MPGALTTVRDDATEALSRAKALLEDMTDLMDGIGQALETSTILRFDEEIAPDGTAWEKSIRAKEVGGKTLQETGELKDSITHLASKHKVVVGSNKIYAGTHQEGATIKAKDSPHLVFRIGDRFSSKKSVTIPARPFLGVSKSDEEIMKDLASAYLQGAA